MSGQFQGKVALVTGGNAGIGRATALAFARQGAKVVISARRIPESEETIRMIKKAGGEGLFVKTDVSHRSEVETLIRKAVAQYGRLDFACNNAGIDGEWAPTAECTEENWDSVININLKGVWLCMKYEIVQMLKQGGGAIVNISSVYGVMAMPRIPAYVASKHGVVGLTQAAAIEYATAGIRVNVICPGLIRTELITKKTDLDPTLEGKLTRRIPLRRMARPEEIAEAVMWLCTDGASYMIGQPMVVDGGMSFFC